MDLYTLIVLSIQLVSAQEKTVTGVVSDSSGPTGKSYCQGTKQSAQTDLDKYNVQAKQEMFLLFLMQNDDKTVVVGPLLQCNFKEKQFLDEVVVVACKQTAKSIVGSVKQGKEVSNKRQVF
jgi:hypothetical protein